MAAERGETRRGRGHAQPLGAGSLAGDAAPAHSPSGQRQEQRRPAQPTNPQARGKADGEERKPDRHAKAPEPITDLAGILRLFERELEAHAERLAAAEPAATGAEEEEDDDDDDDF